jgi:putative ABC transport system permease protein
MLRQHRISALSRMQSLLTDIVLAARNLIRQPRRSTIAITAITFGIVALLLASGFAEWIFFDMRESTIREQLGHLQITRPGYHDAGASDPSRFLLPVGGPDFDAVARLPGVVTIAPRLAFSGLASHGDATVSFIGHGVSPGREADMHSDQMIVEGTALRENDRNGALLGAGLARNLGVKLGDSVVLVVTKPSGGINAIEVTVRGLFSTISKAYDDSALRIPIETAWRLLQLKGAHTWVVLLDETRRVDMTVAVLRQRLASREFQVVSWYELADFYKKTVTLFSRQVEVVRVIIAIIIVLSIANTMMMSVMERTAEIGTLMALGVRRRRILGLFLSEGGLLGIIGGVLGLLLGFSLASAISFVGIPMPAPPGMAHGFTGRILVTPDLAAQGLALAILTTLAASSYPAWKASRMIVVDALRHTP